MDEQAFRRERLLASGLLRGWGEHDRSPAVQDGDSQGEGGTIREGLTHPGSGEAAPRPEEEAESLA
jgi:hypothetical protein